MIRNRLRYFTRDLARVRIRRAASVYAKAWRDIGSNPLGEVPKIRNGKVWCPYSDGLNGLVGTIEEVIDAGRTTRPRLAKRPRGPRRRGALARALKRYAEALRLWEAAGGRYADAAGPSVDEALSDAAGDFWCAFDSLVLSGRVFATTRPTARRPMAALAC